MADFHIALDKRLHAYLLANEPPEHEELRKLRERTATMPVARMQIAPEQGHFLAFLARPIGARRTLELGTFTGYSALAVALALPARGRVVTCDIDAEWVDIARPYWDRAGVADRIEVVVGQAGSTLQQMESGGAEHFDLAFIDANKEQYDSYYESALRLVRPGGLIVMDNMLQHGRVADADESRSGPAAMRSSTPRLPGTSVSIGSFFLSAME
jgi:O-methyltransferase